MGAQLPLRGVQTAEVDDPAYTAGTSRGREVLRVQTVQGLELSPSSQRMDEVVGDVHLAQGPGHAVGVGCVALDDVHLVVPFTVGQVPGLTRHDPDAEAGRAQLGDQATADVSGG